MTSDSMKPHERVTHDIPDPDEPRGGVEVGVEPLPPPQQDSDGAGGEVAEDAAAGGRGQRLAHLAPRPDVGDIGHADRDRLGVVSPLMKEIKMINPMSLEFDLSFVFREHPQVTATSFWAPTLVCI